VEESEIRKRELAIMLGKWAAEFIRPTLDFPHDLEYEKTFYPWMILCKKKYAGPKYEDDPLKSSMTHMGIVLKRRDNAKIVKKICGGILNLMMTQKEIEPIVRYARETLNDIIEGKYDHTYFVTTKRLRADYKNPDQIAHAYLAKRMRERDPGSAPQVNDRISYVQVYRKEQDSKKKKILQGDKIEEVGYVLANKLEIDYLYYITNQIMIPACQFLDLIVPGSVKKIFQPVIDKIEFKRIGRTNILEKFFTSEKKGPFSVAMF
jgi:DNA polymerase delta subunit 1